MTINLKTKYTVQPAPTNSGVWTETADLGTNLSAYFSGQSSYVACNGCCV
jgi:hypothetical protein